GLAAIDPHDLRRTGEARPTGPHQEPQRLERGRAGAPYREYAALSSASRLNSRLRSAIAGAIGEEARRKIVESHRSGLVRHHHDIMNGPLLHSIHRLRGIDQSSARNRHNHDRRSEPRRRAGWSAPPIPASGERWRHGGKGEEASSGGKNRQQSAGTHSL